MKLHALPLALLFAASPLAGQNLADLPADFREARTSARSAFVGFDAAAAARWFAEDAVVDMAGQVITGLPAIRDQWLPGTFATLNSLSFEDGTFAVNGDQIAETARHVAGTPEGAQPGTHKMTWKKTPSGWRIVRLDVY